MKKTSLFSGVLGREVAFTALLGNLLRSDKNFQREFADFMVGETIESLPMKITNENPTPDGRYDISFKYDDADKNFCVEVKVHLETGPTHLQRKEKHSARWLIPWQWEHVRNLNDAAKSRIRYLECLPRALTSPHSSEVLNHFIRYIEETFPVIQFEPEDKTLLNNPEALVATIRKINEIILATAKRLENEFSVKRVSYNETAYGFYLCIENKEVLWVGNWPEKSLLAIACKEDRMREKGYDYFQSDGWMVKNFDYLLSGDSVAAEFFVGAVKAMEGVGIPRKER